MSAFRVVSEGLVPKGPGRGDAAGPLLRRRLAGIAASLLAHGAVLGVVLACGENPSRPLQNRQAEQLAVFTLPAPRPLPHEAPRAARSLRKAPLQAQPAAHAPGLPKVSPPPGATGAPAPSLRTEPFAPPAIASLPALAPIAPHAPAGEPAKASQKADRAALPADYVHKVWARIMACRPAGITIDGRVTLRFDLDDRGHLASVAVVGPSGVAMLDRAAVVALRRAAPFPLPPAHDAAVPLHFEVQVRFGAGGAD
ncbi:MAG: TonB family protein [Novosphingobium aromaticivorans]|nr:TonB family protein [Novosphingobium aromaticivorans]